MPILALQNGRGRKVFGMSATKNFSEKIFEGSFLLTGLSESKRSKRLQLTIKYLGT